MEQRLFHINGIYDVKQEEGIQQKHFGGRAT